MTVLRDALPSDLATIIALIADDPVSAARGALPAVVTPQVQAAFEAIRKDPCQRLLVAENEVGEVVGCLQLSLIPGLSRNGMRRAMVEAVRVRRDCRSRGLGEALMHEAMRIAREAGCGLIQLTTDKQRTDAHRFYARLGFVASHEGMKRVLD